MKLVNKLEHSLKFVTCSGERFKRQFHGEVQEDGRIELIEDEPVDMWRQIQAEGVGADLPSIVARATAGDPTAFRNDNGFYADVVGMPTTYAEILNTVNAGREQFEKMPAEVRIRFDNSFEKWFATLGNKEWFEAMEFQPVKNVEPVVEEKKE